ncbi:MAG: glutamine-hydrolyzing GMP synthase [Acidobacteriota bacterium]|nr:glutamine-hydrolyzing GMP synthase [Blastocatellia bacterium]MDW8413341.1 glutamine-hydrolyzing GMP synthase [Acidobacteriota bacterium]
MRSHQTVLILDFGSQYTQLIARRIRELQVYCEILPFNTPADRVKESNPIGIVLSGGPSSVYEPDAPRCPDEIFHLGVPLLGICYGFQLLVEQFGGKVVASPRREYGAAEADIVSSSKLFAGLDGKLQVWMSHSDHISELPPKFTTIAKTPNAIAAAEAPYLRIYGLQFHPEVSHTPQGKNIIDNFLKICGSRRDWTMSSFINDAVESIQMQIGQSGRAICGLSGGVDSSVAATLVSRAIGSRLSCVFVDNGLLRKNEFEDVLSKYRQMGLNIVSVAAGERFLTKLAGIEDPEAKRKTIGQTFIEIFEEQAERLSSHYRIDYLVQGTLYPDVIESKSVKGPSSVIKSHHNVGGLPEKMQLKLIEPLRELFKDEVRSLANELGLPQEIILRQPFPGPGLAVRILGEVNADRVKLLQDADKIVEQEITAAGYYDKLWQAFAVLLPVRTVGVMGDLRTYEYVVAIRAVTSQDGMTADWARLPYELLDRIARRIVSEVRGINRVTYDISSKPPSTIEWE